MISGAIKTIPTELQTHIEFQTHNFFTEKLVHGADVCLLRNTFHIWSDSHAFRNLKVTFSFPKARVEACRQ